MKRIANRAQFAVGFHIGNFGLSGFSVTEFFIFAALFLAYLPNT
jgi:hypothetical protein